MNDQRMITAHHELDRSQGPALTKQLIESLSGAVAGALIEFITLGAHPDRTRDQLCLAYFDRPGTRKFPNEPINGRVVHVRVSTLGLCNPTIEHRRIAAGSRRFQIPITPRS